MCNKVTPITSRTVRNVEETFWPLFWLNRIIGMAIIELPSGNPWPILTIFLAIVRFILYGLLLWYALITYKIMNNLTIPIIITVSKIILFVNVVIAIISTILGLINYKKVKRFLKKITLVDETLEIFGIDPEYTLALKENTRTILIWLLGGFIIIAGDTAINTYVYKFPMALLKVLAFEYTLLINPVVELNFAMQISTFGKRFERLNALIQSVTTTPLQASNFKNFNKYENIIKKSQVKVTAKSNIYYNNRNNIQLILKAARQIHLDLCATAREVNDTCSKQISMQMAATFLLFTGFSYCLYLIYNEPSMLFSNKIQHYTTLGVWILVSIFRMIHVVRASVNVTAEAQKTSQIAHEIQVSRLQNKLTDEIHQLSLQIMQHPLYFTASDLIVLDFGYVRGFVGSVTTYLMILIQNQPDMVKVANTFVESAFLDNNTNAKTISSNY